jgi:hypothetical protein
MKCLDEPHNCSNARSPLSSNTSSWRLINPVQHSVALLIDCAPSFLSGSRSTEEGLSRTQSSTPAGVETWTRLPGAPHRPSDTGSGSSSSGLPVNGAQPPKDWTTHSEPGNPAGSDPLNIVFSAKSTVSLVDLLNAFGKVPETATVLGNRRPPVTLQTSWQEVNTGLNIFAGQCISPMDADVEPASAQASAIPQDFSARVGGCITVSTEEVCGLWHCVLSYDQAARSLISDITTASNQQGWTMTSANWQGAGGPSPGTGSNGVGYSGNVSVITLTK